MSLDSALDVVGWRDGLGRIWWITKCMYSGRDKPGTTLPEFIPQGLATPVPQHQSHPQKACGQKLLYLPACRLSLSCPSVLFPALGPLYGLLLSRLHVRYRLKKQSTKFAPAFLQAAQFILGPVPCPSSHGFLQALDAIHFLTFALIQAHVSS